MAFLEIFAGFAVGLAAGGAGMRLAGRAAPRGDGAAHAAERDARFQAVIDAIPAMISCRDDAGRYVFMNAYQAELFAATPEAARGKTEAELLGAAGMRDFGEIDRRVLESGLPIGPVEEEWRDRAGNARLWLTTRVPLRASDGAIRHIVTVALDVTQQRAVEQRLMRSADAAEQANRAKAAFLANMSHELRTPLNAVIGFGEMIATAMYGPVGNRKYQEYARDIVDSGRYLLAIITDILDLSKIEAGRFDIVDETVDLHAVFESCERLAAARAENGGVTLAFDAPPDLPMVRGDQRAITQVLVNLISNAIKFTPAGGGVRVAAELLAGEDLQISVSDTGIGMAPEDIRVAMRPFEQLDRGLTKKFEGTGLGLPIAKGLIESHGGQFKIASALNAGTTVTITLPPERVLSDTLILQAAQAGA
jgi:PAS domain S-box-containing protein